MNSPQTGTLPPGDDKTPAVSRALRLREGLKDLAPTFVLVATLGTAALVYFGGGEAGGHFLGFAQTVPQSVAPLEPGRLSAIQVAVGDHVAAGQIVATLDSATLDAEIAVAEARKIQLEADVLAEQTLLEQRLDQDVGSLELERARQREEQARVAAESKALDSEVTRVKRLVADRQAVLDDLTLLALRQASATALSEAKPRTLGVVSRQLQDAERRRRKAKEQSSALAAKLSAGLLVAERSIELLHRRKEGYVLRAGHAGVVSAILRWTGDVIEPGKTVMEIVSSNDRVVACIPERSALALHEGDAATLHVRGRGGAPLHGKAIALGPVVTELPTRCWLAPRTPMWGREVTVALDEPVELLAGQAFDITFEPVHGAPPPAASTSASASVATSAPPASSAPASTAASSPPAGSLLMTVPPELSARSRFEPSGVLARPTESRYLIVSDDTGREGDEGEPWLFAMSPSGAVEADPVVVSGVRQINDLESITAGDAGEIYVLSSQSYSKKGKRKRTRTALLRLRPEGRGLRADGEAHLAEWLDADPARASALGLPEGTRSLDIEGLAFKGGALYLGLKAPLDARGNAMIWRVTAPSALFDAGASAANGDDAVPAKRFEAAGIEAWATARVDVELGGQTTPGGISDLLFLPDGTLALASTPSTAEGAAGAVWRVDEPHAGDLTPRLIQRFTDLKPEGLAPSLGAGKLLIVFDTGDAAPRFQEIAWAP